MKILPLRLELNKAIGLVSPSAPLAHLCPHRLQKCIESLSKLGFKTKLGDHACSMQGYVSASPYERASDIHKFLKDPEVGAIMCLIGGYHFNHLIPHLDFSLFKEFPKPIIGYSDATILQIALLTEINLITFYGPAGLTQFAEHPEPLRFTVDSFLQTLCSTEPPGALPSSTEWTEEILNWFTKEDLSRPRNLKISSGPLCLRGGTAHGKLIGGCLSSLIRLRGTRFWPNFNNSILFLETPEGSDLTKGLDIKIIDAELMDLANSGVFEEISGILLGRSFGLNENDQGIFFDIVLDHTKSRNLPILANLDFGHTDPMLTLPIGAEVYLDSKEKKVEVTEKVVL